MTAQPKPTNSAADEPALPTHDENGVDLTLVRYTLSLTPSERLEMLEKKDLAMLPVLKATLAERPQE